MELQDMPHFLKFSAGNEYMMKHIWCLVKHRHQTLKTVFIMTTILLTAFCRILLFTFVMKQNSSLFIISDAVLMTILCFIYLCLLSLINRTFFINYNNLANQSDFS
ncbi:uncharacterized protein SOCG_04966 [Schizosaccharomyces octosporus yFS286]|uniref:Uncharacterized protein n=1 Tax=Schizosaccharomyces octosporus (strain yFS286) TaxID=483514 RepID=S9Q027_SCHOY|nr:uncharacterized protein SOCG_04966 [Schizosaccharomyces octosporus yFS286]EPX73557.1 hypothetical protein SOCG_04966 [Schizosaccharomyces octosporus yFS286]